MKIFSTLDLAIDYIKIDSLLDLQNENEFILITKKLDYFFEMDFFINMPNSSISLCYFEDNQFGFSIDKQFQKIHLPNNSIDSLHESGIYFIKNYSDITQKKYLYYPYPKYQQLPSKEKIFFLDRDGIINIDKGYISQFDQIAWKDGIIEFLKKLNEQNYQLIIITNQSGIARNYYSELDVIKLHLKMDEYLKECGVTILSWLYSPYNPEGEGPFSFFSHLRKPHCRMCITACERFNITIKNSLMIGDKMSDEIIHPELKGYLMIGDYPIDPKKTQYEIITEFKSIKKFF